MSLLFDLHPLPFKFLNAFLQLAYSVFVDIFGIAVRFLVFQLIFYLLDFLFLNNVVLMQLSQLFLFFIYGLLVLSVLLGKFCQIALHPFIFPLRLLVLTVLHCFVLHIPDLLQGGLFLFKIIQLFLEQFQFVFLLDNLINVVFVVQIFPELLNQSLVFLNLQLLAL